MLTRERGVGKIKSPQMTDYFDFHRFRGLILRIQVLGMWGQTRPRQVHRNPRDQLKHTLSPVPRLGCFRIHHSIYPQFPRSFILAPRTLRGGLKVIYVSPIPDASDFVSRDDLDEMAGICVANLDELAIEEQDMRWIPDDPISCALPPNRISTTRVSMFVDIQPKLCGRRLILPLSNHPAKNVPL